MHEIKTKQALMHFIKTHTQSLDSFKPKSSWSFHGKELPFTPFTQEKFPMGHILWKNIQIREMPFLQKKWTFSYLNIFTTITAK